MFADVGFWLLGAIDLGLVMLAGVVFLKAPQRGINRSLAALSALAGGWTTVAYLEDAVSSIELARFLVGVDFALAALMCAAFTSFSLCFAFRRPPAWALILPWIPATAFFVLSAVTSTVITQVSRQPGGLQFETGPLFLLYALCIVGLLTAGIAALLYQVSHSRGIERVQGEFVLLGLFVSSFVVAFTNLILPRLMETPAAVSRLGSFSIAIFVGTTGYAIVRHRLLDIRLVVARSIAYSLLILILGSSYAASLFLLQATLFRESVGVSQIISSSLLALIMALTFQPLRHFLERVTDGVFFRDRYDAGELLARLGRTVSSTIILNELTRRVLSEVVESFHLEGGAILVRDRDEKLLVQNQRLLKNQIGLADVESLFHHHQPTVFDDLPEGHRKALLRRLGVSVIVPLEARDGIVGLILLGAKKSGDPYSEGDLEVLQILAPELSVGIENARAYHQIERFNETLRLRVERATRKLREANSHLRELDKAKDEFISLASHQLRTPLTAIKGYLSMVEQGDAGRLKPEQAEFIHIASEGAERMASLIDDLLNVSRMDAGRFVIDRTPVDLAEMVEQEMKELQPHADSRHLKLVYHAPKQKLPTLMLDSTKTRQVIINFIDNAIYYTKEGTVLVSLERVGEAVEFRVKDTGIGIPPQAQEKLFAKFFRAENARDVRPDGTGLGLYLAKQVVEIQGGEIVFASELGKGSTFGFRFPISTGPKPRRPLGKSVVAAYHRRRARRAVNAV